MDQALIRQGIELHSAGRLDEAAAVYNRVLKGTPKSAQALSLLGVLRLQQGRTEQALKLIESSIKLEPNQPLSHNNRGIALFTLGRYADAVESYKRVVAIAPAHAEAHNNLGNALCKLDRALESIAHYDRAIALKPDYAIAHYNRGAALEKLRAYDDALGSFARALALNPAYLDAHLAQGNVLTAASRAEEAIACFDRAAQTAPDDARAYFSRAHVLFALNRLPEAIRDYERAFAIDPSIEFLQGDLLHAKQSACAWGSIGADFVAILKGIDEGTLISAPFPLFATPSSPRQQLRNAAAFIKTTVPMGQRAKALRPYTHKRVVLAYVSDDFYNHATSHLLAEMIERHDRERFQVIGVSLGADRGDEMGRRMRAAFDVFIDASAISDEAIVAHMRGREVDIAIDLKGTLKGSRIGIFARRAAPVQASYLGYPGTMGADFIDYLVADEIVIPPDHQAFYSEKIAYVAGTYQVNDSKREISPRAFLRAELGLPESGFVFCCFNNNYKITPAVFDIWMRLLKAVDGSVLWLYQANAAAADNLRAEAETRGVSASRLVFAPQMRLAEHLARHAHADLFLDTFYCNAHTTASDALWAGLPVLTVRGETFAGRVAESVLTAVGLPELVAANGEGYEARAFDLARNPEKVAALKAKLRANRMTYPLFDTARFTRHIEQAYLEMHRRSQAGQKPAHFAVQADGAIR